MYLRLAWTSLHSLGWRRSHNLPASDSQVHGLHVCVTIPSSYRFYMLEGR